ncbi:MAG: tRNA pseudouridine(55) synthase TruB [Anaeroplasma sp.]
MDGFILLDKPKGMTSLSACNKIKSVLNLNKCGHCGTLDPDATGLLLVATDHATKLLKLVNEEDKEYIATIIFGLDSDTYDVYGNITKDINMDINYEQLIQKTNELSLITEQMPPMTSAIKVNGKKLYEYQRRGIAVDIKKRNVKIYDSRIISDLRLINNHYEIDIYLRVSKGFYVRSYAHDLGEMLNGCAIIKDLRRIGIGKLKIENTVSFENLTKNSIISIDKFFDFPSIEVNDYIAKLVRNGVMLDERQTTLNGVFYVKNNCDIIAIYEETTKNKYKPILILK